MPNKNQSDPWVICVICDGDSTYVNPAIDSHGLSVEDLDEDPGFAEKYMNGTYNVYCKHCGGTGKMRQSKSETLIDRLAEEAADRRLAAVEDGNWEAYSTASDPRW